VVSFSFVLFSFFIISIDTILHHCLLSPLSPRPHISTRIVDHLQNENRCLDIQGHAIFIDIPLPKIRHLLVSAIPNIHAHFPTTVTFPMRLLDLFSNAKDSTDAINRALIALQCPFIAQSSHLSRLIHAQTQFHSLYTLNFFYRLNLIDGKGDLAGLLTHIHYVEPANIFLAFVMAQQLFHSIKDPEQIITISAYL
jgi:hypothetical protein